MENSKRKDKNFFVNSLPKLLVISLLVLTGSCSLLNRRQSTNKPILIDWGPAGERPMTVYMDHSWVISAQCYPECD